MRNILIHEYFGVDLDQVWNTIKKDILELKREIEKMWPHTYTAMTGDLFMVFLWNCKLKAFKNDPQLENWIKELNICIYKSQEQTWPYHPIIS